MRGKRRARLELERLEPWLLLAGPDLTVGSATAPASAVLSHDQLSLSWTVRNQGDAEAPGGWYDRVMLSTDPVYDSADIEVLFLRAPATPLAPGGSLVQTATVRLPGFATGANYLIFVADGYETCTETDETNNTLALPITLTAPDVNLVPTSLTVPATLELGSSYDLSWTIRNSGTEPAEARWTDEVYLSRDPVLNIFEDAFITSRFHPDTSPLGAGQAYTITQTEVEIPSYLGAGSYYLILVADAYNRQAESTETDNRLVIPVELRAPDVDLSVTAFSISAVSAPGTSLTVTWSVTNAGMAPTTDSYWYDGLYLSTDDAWDPELDEYRGAEPVNLSEPLAGGASYSITREIFLPLVPGTAYTHLIVVADAFHWIADKDRSNNWRALKLSSSSSADLAVTAASSPAEIEVGGRRSLQFTVTNLGTSEVSDFVEYVDAVYLSDDATLDAADILVGSQRPLAFDPLGPNESYTAWVEVTIPANSAPGRPLPDLRHRRVRVSCRVGRVQ